MKEIISFDAKALRTGRSRGKFMPGGLWDNAIGLNPYLESDSYRGVVALSPDPVDKTGSVIVDIPTAYCKDERGSTYDLYILGGSGHFYNVTAAEVVTDLRSGTPIDTPANGMAIMQPRAASSPTLLFARQTRIGTWNLSGTYSTGWNDTAYNPGTTTAHRPMHRFLDRVYYGNKQYVGEFSDDGTSTIAHEAQALDIEGTETVTAIDDDGRYLVVGASHVVTESYGGMPRCRVLFWDAAARASSWAWEITIPNESSIRGMKREGNFIHVIGARAQYAVQFAGTFEVLQTFDSDETIPFDSTSYGHPQAIASWGQGVIFGKLGTALSKFLPNTDRIVYNPLRGFTGDISLIIPDFLQGKIHIGTRSSKFYSASVASAGASATPIVTRIVPLGGWYTLSRLDIDLPNGIAGSDVIQIQMQGKHGTETVQLPNITQAKYGDKHYLSIPFKNLVTADVRLSFTLSAGVPSFSHVALWGEPAPNV